MVEDSQTALDKVANIPKARSREDSKKKSFLKRVFSSKIFPKNKKKKVCKKYPVVGASPKTPVARLISPEI